MKNGNGNGHDDKGRFTEGNAGGGRPKNEFRARMLEIINDPKVKKAFVAVLQNPDHPQFSALWKTAAAYAVGQPAQVIEHSGGIELNVRELSDAFTSRVDRITQRLRAASVAPGVN